MWPSPADVSALSDSAGESAEALIKDLLSISRRKVAVATLAWTVGNSFEHYNAIEVPALCQGRRAGQWFNLQTHGDLAGYADI